MELWIRTQDKECLMKVDRIDISDNNTIMANGFEIWLGAYKSKERALEVLDEIQNHIQKQGKTELDNEVGLKYYGNIYEMPKE